MHEWLNDYRQLEREIAYLDNSLERNKRELKRWVEGDLAGVKLSECSLGSQVEQIIERIEYELAHKMNDLETIKKLISTFDGIEYQILYLKNVEGKTLQQIAERLNYSYNHIKNKHSHILKCMRHANKVLAR